MPKLIVALALLLVLADGMASDMTDATVGKTYWINDTGDNEASVYFFSDFNSYGLEGHVVTLANSHSFAVLALVAPNPNQLAYKVRLDDGQVLYVDREQFQRSLFSEKAYAFEGRGYLSIHQYIFTRPPGEIIGTISHKQTAGDSADCEKLLKTHGFLTRAQFQCGFENYSSQLIEDARTCAQRLTDAELNKKLLAGMTLFDHEEKEKGHSQICTDVLRDFPSYIKR